MLPAIVGLSATQTNITVDNQLASLYGNGPVPWLNYAFRLMQLPIGLFGVAIATATLAAVSHQAAQNDLIRLQATGTKSLRLAACLTFPATARLILLRFPLIRFLYEGGEFTSRSTELVAWALLWYAAGLVGHSVVEVLGRAFYAMHDTKTPLIVGIAAMSLNVVFSFAFLAWFARLGWMPHGGLALANSLATALEMLGLDYGRYTFNASLAVHHLVFAVDALPGIDTLDNLGLPESGDGLPDVFQEALREVELLLQLQDDDGGFFAVVQPRDRPYETDALPDHGDPHVLFPKSTQATAAATAALAQLASSPAARRHAPQVAARALEAARRGWTILAAAWQQHGRAGAYQAVHHYGTTFEDEDEVAWAATEVFLATGDAHARDVMEEYAPGDPATLRWGFQHAFEGYGAAARSCAFAAPAPGAGELPPSPQRGARPAGPRSWPPGGTRRCGRARAPTA